MKSFTMNVVNNYTFKSLSFQANSFADCALKELLKLNSLNKLPYRSKNGEK